MDLIWFVPILGIVLMMIPVAGLTLHFAVKPIVDTLASAIRDAGRSGNAGQLSDLREEIEALQQEVRRLREARSFDQNLLGAKDGADGA